MASLYEDILEIARDYMGIAAEEYVERRCRIVLQGLGPEEMTVDKIDRLVAGIEMTAKVYMNPERAAAFKRQVEALRNNTY